MSSSALGRSAAAPFVEIGWIARELGVTPSTLRTWERRYQLVVPHRGDQGQRLYDRDQVALLRRVLKLIRGGARASAAHDAVGTRRPIVTTQLRLEPSPEAHVSARRAVDELLCDDAETKFAFQARLVAGELVENAVAHGSKRDPIVLELNLYEDALELAVQNAGAPLHIKNLRRRSASTEQGLEVIDVLADAWSIATGASGTRIWVRLALDPDAGR
jgi:anti-sigma regulatory factor (Ser/Thr protein kinase)/transposase-like protein